MSPTPPPIDSGNPRFVAIVNFGDDRSDVGTVYTNGTALWVEWPDGGADVVHRDRRGWLWDEYGHTVFHDHVGRERKGTRLPIVSRRRKDIPGGCATSP